MMALTLTLAGIYGERMALAALSTEQAVALVAGAWAVVIVVVVVHQIVHRRLQNRRFDRRLDSLRDAKQSGAAHSVGDSLPAASQVDDAADERVRGITIDNPTPQRYGDQTASYEPREWRGPPAPQPAPKLDLPEPEEAAPAAPEPPAPEPPAPVAAAAPPPPAPVAAPAPTAPPPPPAPTAGSLHEAEAEAEAEAEGVVAGPAPKDAEPAETLAELAGEAPAQSANGADKATGDESEDVEENDFDKIRVAGVIRKREQPEPLHFTAYHPREVAVETWQTLLVYAHTEAALPELRADVERYAPLLGERPRDVSGLATRPVEQGTELTFVPHCAGVTFTPDRVTVRWGGGLSRAEFRFTVGAEQAGTAGNGEVTIFAGPLIIGTLRLAMLFDERDAGEAALENGVDNTARVTGSRFERIFASYSHADTKVVLACRDAYRALGLTVDIDVDSLRSGDPYAQVLRDLIREADVFQLFWSRHAAESTAVRTEWEWALGHDKGPGYIRPVYWEQPMPLPPPELADRHFAYLPLPE